MDQSNSDASLKNVWNSKKDLYIHPFLIFYPFFPSLSLSSFHPPFPSLPISFYSFHQPFLQPSSLPSTLSQSPFSPTSLLLSHLEDNITVRCIESPNKCCNRNIISRRGRHKLGVVTFFYQTWVEVLNLPDGYPGKVSRIVNEEVAVVQVRSDERLIPTLGPREKWRRKWWVGEWVGGWVGEWVSGWVGRWVGEWVGEWVSEWVGRWVGEWVSGWYMQTGLYTYTCKTSESATPCKRGNNYG